MEYLYVAVWVVLYAVLAALGLPIAARLFRHVPGRGPGFALPISLLVVTLVAHWVGQLSFGFGTAVVAVAVLLLLSALTAFDLDALRERRFVLSSAFDVNRRAIADTTVVFLVAFAFLIAIRAADPAVHAGGGEKFLDYGLLKTLLRAEALPPEDFWFAGEVVQYYYGGHLLTVVLAMLTDTPARFAYNLSLAGFYAMLVTATFDLAGSVAASRGGARRPAGLLSAFFVGLASNLVTGARVTLAVLPESLQRPLAGVVAAETTQYSTDDLLASIDSFSYWTASRVIDGTINEFPLFAWLNGDLHGHMMGMPFLLLGAALAFAYFRTPDDERTLRRTLLFVALPALGGLQIVLDTWSFPSLFGVAALALVFAPARPETLLPRAVASRLRTDETDSLVSAQARRLVVAVAVVAVVGVFAAVLGAPFLLAGASSREIALLGPANRAGLGALLLVHGAFVVGFAAYLLSRLVEGDTWLLAASVVGVVVVAVMQGMAAVALILPLLVFGWVALAFDRDVGYETVLVVAGAGLVLLVEFVYVNEQAGPLRMNTVFKTYMQVWVLWATALGPALTLLLARPLPTRIRRGVSATDGGTETDADGSGETNTALTRISESTTASARTVALGLTLCLVVSTSFYAPLALSNHFEGGGEPTLDATQFAETYHPEEAKAIAWLDEKPGRPTLLSAPGTYQYPDAESGSYPYPPGRYNWNANPASTLTGIPTVAGWGHEIGYRGFDTYIQRVEQVDAAFANDAALVDVVREYDVQYIWVGPAERERYGETSVGDVSGVSVAYQTETVTIYEVNHDELPGSDGS
ncbi:hypothetical protein AUR64_08960 [Haloprofundus marisrubri]|uniref:Chlor_Arch_YYY domain-containing protein n=1 Tax=Haloprofundus marisrubri TaxID=1514971 RepID=A0A0W1R8S4_9EURY|nr:DUF2298 domain-containing protein [Haloprofundus marisrubri]KTG09755.1 hypothetical protein AUR64_08960 [Haloprofundus marisrubri]